MALKGVLVGTLCLLWTFNCVASLGSGSGSGMIPMGPSFTSCPTATIYENITRPVTTTSYTQVNITEMNFPTVFHPNGSMTTISVSSSIEQLVPATLYTRLTSGQTTVQLSPAANFLLITIGGNLVFVTDIFVDVSLIATDTSMLESPPCNLTIRISVQDPVNCTVQGSTGLDIPFRFARQIILASHSLSINFEGVSPENFTTANKMQIGMVMSSMLNIDCPLNCNRCNMASTCTIYIQNCQAFSTDDVVFFGSPTATITTSVNVRRRRAMSSTATAVTFYLLIPDGAPLSSFATVRLVPPETAMQIVTAAIPMLQNMTGYTVLSVERFITSSNIVLTTFFAQIILPVFITLMVLILLGGITIIVVVLYCKKQKKKSKVIPVVGRSSENGFGSNSK